MLWLDHQSLWLDEGSTWQMIQHSWGALLWDLVSLDAAYPLYHLLLKGWVVLAGDSEWALRFPSAVAGAGAVVALFATPLRLSAPTPLRIVPCLVAGLLLLTSPFALWYAQEAKTYSLLLLTATLLLGCLLHALQHPTRRAWLLSGSIALIGIFVHRLALLLLLAAWASWLLTGDRHRQVGSGHATVGQRLYRVISGRWSVVSFGLACVSLVAAMVKGLGRETAETGAIPAPPLQALWLTFVRFSVDRWPGEFPLWWLLPWIALTVWGGVLLLRHSLARDTMPATRHTAQVLLCFLGVPLVLFLTQLVFTRMYEARYLLLIYPAWILLLVYPLLHLLHTGRHRFHDTSRLFFGVLLMMALGVNIAALTQPGLGLFSGDPVKEQYREAMQELIERLHPDDLVVLHPEYLRPLYAYYMRRLTTDPPLEPTVFDEFKRGQATFNRRDWHSRRQQAFSGYLRSFLLIAPDHARFVDPPQEGDTYGMVGLYFQYTREQRKWPCGIWKWNGVHLFCQSSPETYELGEVAQPAIPVQAQFGSEIVLFGYTLKAITPAGSGVYQAGGTLPITLFWDVLAQPEQDYSIFVHLCQDCELPPVASQDGPPLDGYLPTSVWLPGKPVHDERAIRLPLDMPPGRYTLLVGVYHPGDPAPSARLPVEGANVLPHQRLVLTTVEVVEPRRGGEEVKRRCPTAPHVMLTQEASHGNGTAEAARWFAFAHHDMGERLHDMEGALQRQRDGLHSLTMTWGALQRQRDGSHSLTMTWGSAAGAVQGGEDVRRRSKDRQ